MKAACCVFAKGRQFELNEKQAHQQQITRILAKKYLLDFCSGTLFLVWSSENNAVTESDPD